ncbi:MAG: FRG domain-containing protein [Hominimerdicola sp.]
MSTKIFNISSLSEYINLITTEKLESYYFRGENQKYTCISSSLVRNFKPTNDTYGLADIYNNLLSEYYQEVGNSLDSLQNEYFLAFAQHHGLKTNLIDFTTAPLVALYFACDGSLSKHSNGYIYLISKDSTVDATDFLTKFSIQNRKHINIYGRLAKHDKDVIDGYKSILNSYEGLLSGKNPFDLVKQLMALSNRSSYCKKSKDYVNSRLNLFKDGMNAIHKISPLIKEFYPDYDVLGNLGINEFIVLLMLYFDDVYEAVMYEQLPDRITFPTAPYLIYRTPLKFDRIQNQCGIFLYQGFLDYLIYDVMGGIMIQDVIPDITIKVHNQKSILKELDLTGINKKFIYGDFDSTAQYINQKYYK